MERKTITYGSTEEFLNGKEYEDADHKVEVPGSFLEMRLIGKETHTLVVFFNGAMHRNEGSPPFYAGNSILPKMSASRLLISDPIFHRDEEVTAGWYMGHRGFPLQKIMPDILNRIMEANGYRRIMFVGGSAGGFATLFYSRLMDDSLSMVWNPQTDIGEYHEKHKERYMKAAFCGGKTLTREVTTSLVEHYSNTSGGGKVIYMQNMSDLHHVKKHMEPFLKGIGMEPPEGPFSGTLKEGFLLHLDEWGDGHIPPPRKSLEGILSLGEEGSDWDEAMRPGKFKKMFTRDTVS